jgi:NAD(P)H-hydrate repair Nnr-like enzyme with NAD(P)H-hydrate dehydratase domain
LKVKKMQPSYWRKQTTTKPLFPDIEWNKPERRDQAGQLGIIGGNKLGFAGVAEAYSGTLAAGVGAVRTLLPDALKRNIPATITDTIFAASNPSGGLARDALIEMNALGNWANSILLIGDAGRNSETALVYDDFISGYDGPLTVTRDAVDLVKNNANLLVDRPNTLLIVSFAQLQRLFQGVYYPKILTFSMHRTQLIEAIHKFTITYPVTIVTLHRDTLIIASDGEVVTQEWGNAMAIWRGHTAARAAAYWLWNPSKPLEAITASIIEK